MIDNLISLHLSFLGSSYHCQGRDGAINGDFQNPTSVIGFRSWVTCGKECGREWSRRVGKWRCSGFELWTCLILQGHWSGNGSWRKFMQNHKFYHSFIFFSCAEEQWMTNHVSFLSNHVISYHIIILIIVN